MIEDKQTPTKPKVYFWPDGSIEDKCPSCNFPLSEDCEEYCPNCGQKLEWEDEG